MFLKRLTGDLVNNARQPATRLKTQSQTAFVELANGQNTTSNDLSEWCRNLYLRESLEYRQEKFSNSF